MATVDQFNTILDSTLERIKAFLPLLDAFERRLQQASMQAVLLERTQLKLDEAVTSLVAVAVAVDTVSEGVKDALPSEIVDPALPVAP